MSAEIESQFDIFFFENISEFQSSSIPLNLKGMLICD